MTWYQWVIFGGAAAVWLFSFLWFLKVFVFEPRKTRK